MTDVSVQGGIIQGTKDSPPEKICALRFGSLVRHNLLEKFPHVRRALQTSNLQRDNVTDFKPNL